MVNIGYGAFSCCENLVNVTIGNGVKNIGDSAFFMCDSLKNISIGKSVETIGEYAFYECTALENVYITDLSAWCNIDFISSPMRSTVNLYVNDALLTDLVIPSEITEIKTGAFCNYKKLESVIIPKTVESIGNMAFYGCKNLKSISISNGITSIGEMAFWGCTNLESVNLPDSVITIGTGAFSYCTGIKSIRLSDNISEMGTTVFRDCESLKSINIPTKLTNIPYASFESCKSLESIIIPENIKSIGDSAFYCCSNLKNITIPDSVEFIGASAFDNTEYSYDSSNFENGVLYINNHLIATEMFNDYGFYKIKEGTLTIAADAFHGKNSLENLNILSSVISIGENAFRQTGLKSVSFWCDVKKCDLNSFSSNTYLTKVFFSKALTEVPSSIFNDCNNIGQIYYEGTEEEWQNIIIHDNNGSLSTATVHFNAISIFNNISGDINGDETVDLQDVVTIAQVVADWQNVFYNQAVANIDGKNGVDLQDVVHLAQYVAKWENIVLH